MGRFPACLAAAVVISLAPTASQGATARRCPPSHYRRLIEVNRQAVIYEALDAERVYQEVFACAYGHRPHQVGYWPSYSSSGGGGIRHVVLSGAVIAYEEERLDDGQGFRGFRVSLVLVRDLRSGRLLHQLPTGSLLHPETNLYPGEQASIGVGRTEQIIVKPDGAVAWIAWDYERSPGKAPEVQECTPTCHFSEPPYIAYYDLYKSDRTGTHQLAGSTGVAPHSLKLTGNTVHWTEDGKAMSATLD